MEKLVIHKNKGEVFKCHFDIDGASIKETSVRLCLECGDNKNMFFYGTLSEDGECIINIPKLKELDNKDGKLFIEAIVDSTYFKLFEATFELKNSVEVRMTQVESTTTPASSSESKTKIKLETIQQEKLSKDQKKEAKDGFVPVKEYRSKFKAQDNQTEEQKEPVKEANGEAKKSHLKNFQSYMKARSKSST